MCCHSPPLFFSLGILQQLTQTTNGYFRDSLVQRPCCGGDFGQALVSRVSRRPERKSEHDDNCNPLVLSAAGCSRSLLHSSRSKGFKNSAVKLFGRFAISSGGPAPRTSPPRCPPSGPRSMIQSAHFIISKLCSITTRVFPASRSFISTCKSFSISATCSPVVGSSRIYTVRPVAFFASSVANLTRCASPPERVVPACPSRK